MDRYMGADLQLQKARIEAIEALRDLHDDFVRLEKQAEGIAKVEGFTDELVLDLHEKGQYRAALQMGIEALETEARSAQKKMERNVSKISVILDKGALKPTRAHPHDAGLDLYSPIEGAIKPGGSLTIDTGVHVQIPTGYVGMLKSKSGLNVHAGIQSEGVIDAGYTGSIVAKLYNHGERTVGVQRGDKITQLVLMPIITPEVELVDCFQQTERGNNGFGSTGR